MSDNESYSSMYWVVIVGGGMVGWFVVGIFVVKLSVNYIVILIELFNIFFLGVGEGFWLLLCDIFFDIGISEMEFLMVCYGVFK